MKNTMTNTGVSEISNAPELRARYPDPATQLGMDRYSVIGCIAGMVAHR